MGLQLAPCCSADVIEGRPVPATRELNAEHTETQGAQRRAFDTSVGWEAQPDKSSTDPGIVEVLFVSATNNPTNGPTIEEFANRLQARAEEESRRGLSQSGADCGSQMHRLELSVAHKVEEPQSVVAGRGADGSPYQSDGVSKASDANAVAPTSDGAEQVARELSERTMWLQRLQGSESVSLGQVPEDLRDDRDVVSAAVSINGLDLRFASARLREDREVVSIALRQNTRALEHAARRFRNRPDAAKVFVWDRAHLGRGVRADADGRTMRRVGAHQRPGPDGPHPALDALIVGRLPARQFRLKIRRNDTSWDGALQVGFTSTPPEERPNRLPITLAELRKQSWWFPDDNRAMTGHAEDLEPNALPEGGCGSINSTTPLYPRLKDWTGLATVGHDFLVSVSDEGILRVDIIGSKAEAVVQRQFWKLWSKQNPNEGLIAQYQFPNTIPDGTVLFPVVNMCNATLVVQLIDLDEQS